jgi:hypothetical protein
MLPYVPSYLNSKYPSFTTSILEDAMSILADSKPPAGSMMLDELHLSQGSLWAQAAIHLDLLPLFDF